MNGIVWLRDFNEDQLMAGGVKALRLAEMHHIGMNTLPGFVILNTVFERFLIDNNVYGSIKDIFERFEEMDMEELRDATRSLERQLMSARIPWNLEMDLLAAYKNLLDESGAAGVVIRPSYYVATPKQELDSGAEANVYHKAVDPESLSSKPLGIKGYINVVDQSDFINKIQKFWCGIYNYEFFKWCKEHGKINPSTIRIGTIVQSVLVTQAYGSMITYTPSPTPEESRRYIQIRARYGFSSESLYDPTPDIEFYSPGSASPWDIYLVHKEHLEIVDRHITLQAMEFAPDPNGGLLQQPLKMDIGSGQKVEDAVILEIAKMGLKLEEFYNMPTYVQWGVKDGTPYVFECRRLTSVLSEDKSKEKKEPIEAQAKDLGEEVVVNVVEEESHEEEGGGIATALTMPMVEFQDVGEETQLREEDTATGAGEYGGYFIKIKAPPLLMYCDMDSVDEAGDGVVDLYYDSLFVSLDSIIKRVLGKHPIHYVQNKDVRGEFSESIRRSISEMLRPHITTLYVRLSHMSPSEYRQFDDSGAYEDPDNVDTSYKGIRRANMEQDYYSLYILELEALNAVSEENDVGVRALLPGITNISEGLSFYHQARDTLSDLSPGVRTGIYVDTISSLFALPSLCTQAPVGVSIYDVSSILESIRGGDEDKMHMVQVGRDQREGLMASIEDSLDLLASLDIEYAVRLDSRDMDYSTLKHIFFMGFPALIVPQKWLLHATRVLNTIERQYNLSDVEEGGNSYR